MIPPFLWVTSESSIYTCSFSRGQELFSCALAPEMTGFHLYPKGNSVHPLTHTHTHTHTHAHTHTPQFKAFVHRKEGSRQFSFPPTAALLPVQHKGDFLQMFQVISGSSWWDSWENAYKKVCPPLFVTPRFIFSCQCALSQTPPAQP